jgi:two-component system, chemotaxis family, sensor kinase CheA
VNTGLLLLDRNLTIEARHSSVVKKTFGKDNFIGKNFHYLVENLVNPNTIKSSIIYFKHIFSSKLSEKQIEKSNPLKYIKINIRKKNGDNVEKYIQLDFRGITHNNKIRYILVIVQDITQSVRLKHTLYETKNRFRQQISTIASIIQSERYIVEDFLIEATREFHEIGSLLSNRSASNITDNFNQIYRIIHKVKGDTAILKLTILTQHLHNFESKLSDLRNKSISPPDQIELYQRFKVMKQCLTNIKQLMAQLTEDNWSQSARDDGNGLFNRLKVYAYRISSDINKRVYLIDDKFSQTKFPKSLQKGITDVLVQLLRNAIVHGIEGEQHRRAAKKTLYGCVHIGVTKNPDSFTVTVRDDGSGLDIKKIKHAAICSKKYSKHAVSQWTDKQALSLIMQPGFSTANRLTEHAGRGIGLDVIKATVEKLGGDLSASTRKGIFTEFSMTFPSTY